MSPTLEGIAAQAAARARKALQQLTEVISNADSVALLATLSSLRLRIDVDGRLNERFYQATPPFDDLIQAVPVSRGVPSERTQVWIGFDATHLYVAARVWDALGEAGWIANEMRRDSTQLRANDSFGIYLEPTDFASDARDEPVEYLHVVHGFLDDLLVG